MQNNSLLTQKSRNFAANLIEYSQLKKLKHIFNSIIWALVGAYILLIVLVHLPSVQGFLGSQVATALQKKFGTKVSVGKVDLGFFNRLIVDDVLILDQKGDSMIYATRLSAKADIMPLLNGRISIASAQLFGLNANVYKDNANSPTNIQFLLDSLASKDTTKHTPLDLHIGSLIIRHGAIRYNQHDVPEVHGKFSDKHIGIKDLSAHIILNKVTDNNINVLVKKIAFKERCGFQLNSLHFKLIADKSSATLEDFELELPHSNISIGDTHATYKMENGKLSMPTLQFDGSIEQSKLTLADVSCFVPIFRNFKEAVFVSAKLRGTNTSIKCQQISLKTSSGSINLQANLQLSDWDKTLRWRTNVDNFNLTESGIAFIDKNMNKKVKLPKELLRIGDINFKGKAQGKGREILSEGKLQTGVGNLDFNFSSSKQGHMTASLSTKGIAIAKILANKQFGNLSASITASGTKDQFQVKGTASKFDFNHYTFHNIKLDGSYSKKTLKGMASIKDPNIQLAVIGNYSLANKKYNVNANIDHLVPNVLGIKTKDKSLVLDNIHVTAQNENEDSYLDLDAPFADIHARGEYDLAGIYQSISNMLAEKLPTLPGIKHTQKTYKNDFTVQANIYSTEVINKMFGLPLSVSSPIHINGNVSDAEKDINLYITLPLFTYNGKAYHGGSIDLSTIGDSLTLDARICQGMPYEQAPDYKLHASASNNKLYTLLYYNNHSTKLPVMGMVNAETTFSKNSNGKTTLDVSVSPSSLMLGDAKWDIQPSHVTYFKDNLIVEDFTIKHEKQYVKIEGKATPNANDSILAELKDVDVAYILNLVNFHSVDFTGKASGKAIVKSIFNSPEAYAKLDISEFTFENGPLGILHANVNYNKELQQIDIKALADDGPDHQTDIEGYVSPAHNYIDLGIEAKGTSMKFMENFCGSFMDNIEAYAYGKLNVVGPLNNINLVGDIDARGKMHMKQLGTEYTFKHLRAHAIPDDIILNADTIYDSRNHFAIVNGGIHHKHLTKLSYDLDVNARNFLGYDTHEFGDNTFYGTVYATGNVGIHGKSGETVIDIDAQPEAGSIFVYNAASPDAISDKSFIHWHDVTPEWEKPFHLSDNTKVDNDIDITSDMRINFLVNTNPNLTLKLLMDPQSGDYINLNGSGVIRANYFNKGSFDMFGNYLIDHGVYKLTIQNLIKKDFQFMPGGVIAFGGNPYNAPLNLQAKYTVNGVPLSDLNIGRSFSSNNIRVDCLMNIKGTPGAPSVDFGMDLPTVNSDAKQMIYSLINSQEEMNQQVLYLLGIGRFYAQAKNNQSSENAEQQSQTSLAMQSLLSGTISQQINTVLSGLIKNNNWNFGANISTGDDGFYNAEYEGILSGRLLNNRLIFNGQFGYRDNPNASQNFIGDFDLRYLIFPNGNLSIRMYNQSNDRYFTRNSLNTQGIGLILKKDFNGFWDFFGIKKKTKKNKQKKAQENK